MPRRRLLLAALLLALVILPRLVAGAASARHYWGRGDSNWDAMAVNLLEGRGLLIPRIGPMRTPMYAHKTPVFALVLAGTYATLGRREWAVILVQIVFSLAATWAVYRMASALTGSRAAGFAAAAASALYPAYVVHDVQVMETALFRGETALLTLLVYRAGRRPTRGRLALLGAVAGLTVLTRTTILLFLLLAATWLLFAWGRRSVRLLPRAALGLALFVLVLSPWLVRNARLFGGIHLVTGGGRSLWIGTSDSFLELFPARSVDAAEYAEWRRLPAEERRRLASLNEVELDVALRKKAVRTLEDDPGRIRPLAVRKTAAAFAPRHNPWLVRDEVDREYPGARGVAYALSYTPVAALGALGIGLLLAVRRSAGALILFHVLAFETFAVLFWAHSRHRYYLDEILMAAAAGVVVTLATRWRRRVRPASPGSSAR